jgi:hypothetical protein
MASSVFDSLIATRGSDPLKVVSYKPDLSRDSKDRPVLVLYPVYSNGERGQYAEAKFRIDTAEPVVALYNFLPELAEAIRKLVAMAQAKGEWKDVKLPAAKVAATPAAPAPAPAPATKVEAALQDFPF